MMRRTDDASLSALLRWYPSAWRERYGDEFVAMMEDSLGDEHPTARFRISIAWAGVRERCCRAGMFGGEISPFERARVGCLVVLSAFAVFIVAGSSFAKLAEHFVGTVPAADRLVPNDSYTVLQWMAPFAVAAVFIGALVAVPAFVRFLREGGWPSVRRRVYRAMLLTAVTAAATVGLAAWAHTLTNAQRNGTDWGYTVAFIVWALLAAATLALWTVAAVAVARRLDLTQRVMTLEIILAIGLTALLVAMTATVAVWWAAMAGAAPWFLHGTPAGTPGSPFEPRLAGTMVVMAASTAAALYGVTHIVRARHAFESA